MSNKDSIESGTIIFNFHVLINLLEYIKGIPVGSSIRPNNHLLWPSRQLSGFGEFLLNMCLVFCRLKKSSSTLRSEYLLISQDKDFRVPFLRSPFPSVSLSQTDRTSKDSGDLVYKIHA